MPLITCPDCSRSVSDAAPTCPGCGRPICVSRSTSLSEPPRLAPVQVSHHSHRETGTFAKSFGNTSGKLIGCLTVWVLFALAVAIAGALGR